MPGARYTPLAILLHWTIAALIALNWLLPHLRGFVARTEAPALIGVHRSIGVTILALVLCRLAWRLFHRPPELPESTIPLVRIAAHAGHAALYLLMLAVPMLGMLFTWASGRDISVWGVLTLPPSFAQNDDLADLFRGAHGLAANTILVLAGLHAAAALLHHYALKDGLLNRMLPERLRL